MRFYEEHIFPRFFDFVLKNIGNHGIANQMRTAALAKVEGPVLEIGVGTGLNLELYPQNIQEIFAIDPNPGMERQLKRRLRGLRSPAVNFYLSGAEKLPFADGSFKTVLSTLTLCSIPDLPTAISEIRRVLKKDGKFVFMEHGLSPDAKVARWQHSIEPIYTKIGCGCKVTVNVAEELQRGGFQIREMQTYYAPKAPKFIGYMYDGVAVC